MAAWGVRPRRGALGTARRTALGIVLGAVAVAMAACALPADTRSGPAQATSNRSSSAAPTSPSDGMRPGVFPSTRVEPPTDANRPDGAAPTPDGELTGTQLAALIRLAASAAPAAGRCAPGDVRLSLGRIEAALGHRYSQIRVTNAGAKPCTLLGWPGLGFRGEWGSAFSLVAEREKTPSDRVGAIPHDPSEPVTLKPGGSATADLEWTGALGGAAEEKVSLVAVQLVAGGPVASLPIPAADHVDIGDATTVRVRAWAPAS